MQIHANDEREIEKNLRACDCYCAKQSNFSANILAMPMPMLGCEEFKTFPSFQFYIAAPSRVTHGLQKFLQISNVKITVTKDQDAISFDDMLTS